MTGATATGGRQSPLLLHPNPRTLWALPFPLLVKDGAFKFFHRNPALSAGNALPLDYRIVRRLGSATTLQLLIPAPPNRARFAIRSKLVYSLLYPARMRTSPAEEN